MSRANGASNLDMLTMDFPYEVFASDTVEVAVHMRPVLRTIDAYAAFYATHTPTALAAVFGKHEITYLTLEREVASLASRLRSHGVEAGQIVAVYSDSRPEAYIALLAASRTGAIFLGLSPRASADEIDFQLSDAQPSAVLDFGSDRRPLSLRPAFERLRLGWAMESIAPLADQLSLNVPWDGVVEGGTASADVDRPAMLLYTSGSTGFPKGAILSQRAVCSSAYLLEYHRCVVLARPTPRSFVLDMPISHNSWSTLSALPALVGGGTIIFHERWNAAGTLKAIEKYRLNTLIFFPPQLNDMLEDEGFKRTDLSSLDTLLPMVSVAPNLLAALRESAPDSVPFTGYGLTEAAGLSGLMTDLNTPLSNVASTVGRPVIPGIEHKLVDDDGQAVEAGVAGELWMRGPIVFSEYLNQPTATAEAVDAEGWLHTGDILVEGPDGDWRIVGRKKEMFKSGGENVYPSEIERVLLEHPDVDEVAVVGAPDPRWSEIGVAFVAGRQGSNGLADELPQFARERLSNFKVPKHFIVGVELPRLPNGKVERTALKEQAAKLVEAHQERGGAKS